MSESSLVVGAGVIGSRVAGKLAAHQAGRVRAAEVRAADFVGPGAQSAMGERIVRQVRRGKMVSVLGRADRAHT
jgi:3-hydroxyacyl-CoA dehydrogenase